MWHTSTGDRTLLGSEAALLKAGITGVVELIKEESAGYADQWEFGIDLFDGLHWSQRLVLLEQVAKYLLTDTPATLDLNAANESAIGAIFQHLCEQIDWEIDCEFEPDIGENQKFHWRKLILMACEERFGKESEDDEFELPTWNCRQSSEWHSWIESLADEILWDRDYEMDADFLDTPPEKAAFLKSVMGVDDDYFSTAAPDVHDDIEIAIVLRRIDELTKTR
jgi:hypothetical protein